MKILRFTIVFTIVCAILTTVSSQRSSEVIDQYSYDLVPLIENSDNSTASRHRISENYESDVLFKFYKDGQLTYISNGINVETIRSTGCTPTDQFAFLLHGWRETCEVDWMRPLIGKLTAYRGGCIICIDYGVYAQDPYVRLLRRFEALSNVMTKKLKYLSVQGFDPTKGYIFGFSFGGQLALSIGQNFGVKLIKEIDTCDMAGPGFDHKSSRADHRDAAQNVQCIHTSRDKGTRYYDCHQNWRMGNCGITQNAANSPPTGSHGLCPHFYISAFDNPFYAVDQPKKCGSKRPAPFWPENFKMGYMEMRKSMVDGELFAVTSEIYPYNVLQARTTPNEDNLQEIPLSLSSVNQRIRKDRPILNTIKRAAAILRSRNQRRRL